MILWPFKEWLMIRDYFQVISYTELKVGGEGREVVLVMPMA